ncbi:MAG: peptidyl-prolyl cis-trans isomerase [Planctomycetes bacterium]|nr:peptidyl-prolyl cis-trans isomerase [Planctomycetota bacterium]
MGKRVLTGLFAVLAVVVALRTGSAQDAPEPAPQLDKPAFKAGKFLTEGDYEHIRDALEYLNLKPEDLNYEKKHRDDRLRLQVCDRALDEPLAVPGIAESATQGFSINSRPTRRCMHAAELLDIGTSRWQPGEAFMDGRRQRELSDEVNRIGRALSNAQKARIENEDQGQRIRARIADLEAKLEEARSEWDADVLAALFGAKPEGVLPFADDHKELFLSGGFVENFATAADSLTRAGRRLGRLEAAALAARVPALVAEIELSIPGGIVSPEATESDLFGLGERAHLDGVLVSAGRVSHILEHLGNTWRRTVGLVADNYRGTSDHELAGVTGSVLAAWQSEWGRFVIGGTGPNTYEGDDFIGIIDLGGDDTYRGRVACGIGLEGRAPISFVLDLSGDDRYLGEDFTQGFGFLGVGILHDLGGGDDVYKSRFCAQGCGLCGYGELYDDGGDDTYTSDSGAQGAGVFGYGHLIDRAGNDVYRGCRYVQGFAQVMGVGVLTDGDGNDLYYAGGKYLHEPLFNDRYQSLSQGFAIGNRYGETGGGVGMLLDEGDGNDVYQADIYGQGSSYWYSLGMLVDEGGNDTYTLGQYGQGGGIHLSAGILVDLKGNDSYTNPHGVGLGGAHDWAVGWLIDREGDDLYQGNGQGQGLNFAVGIMMDCAGNDSHSTNHANSIGHGHNNDISLLLDFEGTDVYGPEEVKDGQFTQRGKHAMVYDVPEGWFSGIDTSTLPTKQDPPPTKVVVQHILISWKGKNERVTLKDGDRTQPQAEALRDEVLRKARKKGGDWAKLQTDHNEDSVPDAKYTVEQERRIFVKPFQDMALSLGKGQIDWCESEFGYHIIKRIE